jgi:CBS domain-containing protein
MRVNQVMHTGVRTVSADDSVGDTIALLADEHISGVPVLDRHGKLVGVVSNSDILEAIAEHTDPEAREAIFDSTPVRDIMTTNPQTSGEATVDAAQRMLTEAPPVRGEDGSCPACQHHRPRTSAERKDRNACSRRSLGTGEVSGRRQFPAPLFLVCYLGTHTRHLRAGIFGVVVSPSFRNILTHPRRASRASSWPSSGLGRGYACGEPPAMTTLSVNMLCRIPLTAD